MLNELGLSSHRNVSAVELYSSQVRERERGSERERGRGIGEERDRERYLFKRNATHYTTYSTTKKLTNSTKQNPS
jgi:hypothetical protein